ncbi:MAG: DUF4398 domain-containing protein [Deltaproteobacteria bacterium]|nr:DUF4398 domain-containing protein [Deltaproteobacteria bacterium]
MNRTIIFTLGTTMALAIGCAHSPTHELVAARSTYAEAKQGPAGEIAKAEVYDAKKALDDAERAHREKPESDKERDLAYVALRKADYANVHAQLLQYRSQNADAHAKYVATLEQLKSSAETQLDSTSQELAAKEKDPRASVRFASTSSSSSARRWRASPTWRSSSRRTSAW